MRCASPLRRRSTLARLQCSGGGAASNPAAQLAILSRLRELALLGTLNVEGNARLGVMRPFGARVMSSRIASSSEGFRGCYAAGLARVNICCSIRIRLQPFAPKLWTAIRICARIVVEGTDKGNPVLGVGCLPAPRRGRAEHVIAVPE